MDAFILITKANTPNGGTGNDVLIGGLGNDTLTGGAGDDIFLFDKALNATINKDSIYPSTWSGLVLLAFV